MSSSLSCGTPAANAMDISWELRNPSAAIAALWCEVQDYFHSRYPDAAKNMPSTVNGETQIGGKVAEDFVAKVLTEMGLSFTRAGTQGSRDFQNVGGIGLDIEVKKTNSNKVIMNDTRPVRHIHYIIFATAAKVKSKNPATIFKTGEELIGVSNFDEFLRACQKIDEARRISMDIIKEVKEQLGNLGMYMRIKHEIDIKDFY